MMALVLAFALASACSRTQVPTQRLEAARAPGASHCTARGPLPDPECTPGAIETSDLSVICGQSTRERRNVSEATKRAVLEAYGVPWPAPRGEYELDHLVSLELGGSNDVRNLWPETADPTPGFHQKDVVENHLHREVCAGRMSLAEAQRAIATDWISVYRQMTGDAGR